MKRSKKKLLLAFIFCFVFCIVNTYLIKEQKVEKLNQISSELAIFLEDEKTDTIPSKESGYVLDKVKSTCNNGAITWDNVSWNPVVKANDNIESRLSCTLYFKKANFSESITMCGESGKDASECMLQYANLDTTNLAYDETDDNNLRYIGTNPNNYISFNGELWRIIGVMKNIDDGTGTKESRLKIIRNESIGSYSWDSSPSTVNGGYGVNEWSQADLMTELNTLYLNSQSGKCYKGANNATTTCDFTSIGLKEAARSMINNAVWNTGTLSGTNYITMNSKEFYLAERSTKTGKQCSTTTYCNDSVTRTTTWTGLIGLMYPSDYGYATSGGSTMDRETCINYKLNGWGGDDYKTETDCAKNSWLKTEENEMLMPSVPHATYATDRFYLNSIGFISNSHASIYELTIRPTLYLSSKITITNGSGAENDPYYIGMLS